MKLAWVTDPHLNFLPPGGARAFGEYERAERQFDAVVITGDIAEAPSLEEALLEFARGVGVPVYFVLGNHDFYRGSVDGVQKRAAELRGVYWLPRGAVPLSATTVLLGQDGFYDARSGHALTTQVLLSDFRWIEDFRSANLDRVKLIEVARRLADADAERARAMLWAQKGFRQVVFATHVPPFREACWHEGKVSDDEWAPWFTNLSMGDVLQEFARVHPDTSLTVLCGHTHGRGIFRPLPNLLVKTGAARYGVPAVEEVLELE